MKLKKTLGVLCDCCMPDKFKLKINKIFVKLGKIILDEIYVGWNKECMHSVTIRYSYSGRWDEGELLMMVWTCPKDTNRCLVRHGELRLVVWEEDWWQLVGYLRFSPESKLN